MRLSDILVNKDGELPPDVTAAPQQQATAPLKAQFSQHENKYASTGYNDAIENAASPDAYQIMLRHLIGSLEVETCDGRDLSRREARELQQQIENLVDEEAKIKNETLPSLRLQYRQIEQRHDEVMRDPTKLHEGQRTYDETKKTVWLTATIAVSFFLYTFYFLVGHAAFIRNIGKSLQNADAGNVSVLFESVFDASAIIRDFADNPANLLICLAFPMVFMSVGYLFHDQLEKRKRGFAFFCLFVIVWLDATMAYKVSSKMYEARFLSGLVDDKWQFTMIFFDVNFYMILLCGLAIYLLWGKILGLYFEEKRNCDRVSTFLNDCTLKMEKTEKEIKLMEEKMAGIEQSLREKKIRVAQLEESRSVTLLSWHKVESVIDSFTAGWRRGMATYYKVEMERVANEEKVRSSELPMMSLSLKEALKRELDKMNIVPVTGGNSL